jgi:hypothetical protein
MPVSAGPRLKISDLISRAQAHGCEVRISKAQLATPDGLRHIRYIYCPHSGKRFDITDYDDDEFMLAFEIKAAERRLGIKLIS